MNRFLAISILAAGALIEAAGDAIVRAGLRSNALPLRILLYVLGSLVLFAYARIINAPPWNFGQLIGLYVVFFFVAAQLISWLAFSQPPNLVVLVGGALIVSGGAVIALWGS